ncbi:MAG TPA: HTTM domain-containing protein [Pirellulaceae bacterium]
MTTVREYIVGLVGASRKGWNDFWFTPSAPESLALIRIFTGVMLLYTHGVWGFDLPGFFGREGRLTWDFVTTYHEGSPFAWTLFRAFDSPWQIRAIWLIAMGVFLLLTLGVATRWTSILAFVFTTSFAHRAAGALFGLDQINLLLVTYLMVGDAGGAYSIDAWIRCRRGWPARRACVSTNIATRLIQIHMCVIYFFAAAGKLQGVSWWEGTAMWLALANYEYQSIDMTFLGQWPYAINLLTHVTLLWELSYCVLIWPRWTRPLMLALAIPLHLGIAVCLGMITFGLIMLVGNLAFVSPDVIRSLEPAASRPPNPYQPVSPSP